VYLFHDYLNAGNAWLFIPAAILLGALHGLEPGHSKTMMAAFIVSIQGTATQALVLGLAATISHTGVIWILAVIGLRYSQKLNVETLEPYFQVGIGLLVIAMAAWTFRRLRTVKHDHQHAHEQGRHGGSMLDAGHGFIEITIFETGVPPQFRLYFYDEAKQPIAPPNQQEIVLSTVRPNGGTELFLFSKGGDFLRSTKSIPEPHEFNVIVKQSQGTNVHSYMAEFRENHHHHDATFEAVAPEEYEDAHERAHAAEIQERFANRRVTNGQIVLFGLTGGLIPCPAAFAVLLVCLQLKRFALGFAVVMAFSLGLAITLMTVGMIAALSVKHVTKHFEGFGHLVRKAPYFSAGIMVAVGMFVLVHGVRNLLH